MAAPMNNKPGDSSDNSDAKCASCGECQKVMKRCTRCRSTVYCSRDCQIIDWPRHEAVCSKLASFCAKGQETDHDTATNSSTHSLTERIQDSLNIRDTAQTANQDQPDAMLHTSEPLKKSTPCQEPTYRITVKCQRDKHQIHVNSEWEASRMLSHISEEIRIPMDKLKLVHKGKLVNKQNAKDFVKDKAVFQAIGEMSESEEGLDPSQIDRIMSKIRVERNEAIRALRLKGDVIDAILYLGNK
ncbi:uncharacterized protein LOC119727351 [Patiria miniata]|uniref:MYND-type domain-containing protein n=1 Tax=Patiria miniata TaxID=46514 RepID=A0A913ZTR1_PATMI|nr:uncharacterized protein LOC119727351 [Patiria miniata]